MSNNSKNERCANCDKQFQYSNGVYAGKFLKSYRTMVCSSCYDSNFDGWSPRSEPLITKNLSTDEVAELKRNIAGLLPRV